MLAPFALSLWLFRTAWSVAPRAVATGIAFSLLSAAIPSLQVIFMADFVAALATADSLSDVSGPFAGLVLVIALASPLDDVARTFQWMTMDRIRLALQTEVSDVMATLSPAAISTPEVAETIEKANDAAQNDLAFVFPQVMSMAATILSVAGVIITLAGMYLPAALLVLVALVPVLLVAKKLSIIDRNMWNDIGQTMWRERYLHGHLVGAGSARELASLGGQRRIARMVTEANEAIRARKGKTYPPTLGWNLGSGLVTSALLALALGALVTGMTFGPEAAGGVYGVMAAMGAVMMLGSGLGRVVQGVAPWERLRALQDLRGEPSHPLVQDRADLLHVSGLEFTYPGKDSPALQGLDLEIHRGQIIAFVGVNGAGKTTAVDSIVGTIEATGRRGDIRIDGRTQEDLGRDAWTGYFGLLTQEFQRYELTLRDSLLLGTPREDVTDDELWAALEAGGAATLARGFENGLDQQLGSQWDGGTGVSGGQWQRIALSRIYLRNAPIWVLDEPTSAIDAEAEQEIFRELQRTRSERITIVVSHRAWTLRGMDEIVVFDQGRVIERGRYDELLAAGGRFAEIFAEQAG